MLLQSAVMKKELIYFVKDKVRPSMFQPGDLDPGFKQPKRSSSAGGPSSASERRGGAPSSSSSSTGGSWGQPSQGCFLQEVFHVKEIPGQTQNSVEEILCTCPLVQEHVETLQKELECLWGEGGLGSPSWTCSLWDPMMKITARYININKYS